MKRKNQDIHEVIYVHLNEAEHYVLSYGIEFSEFYYSLSDSLNQLLLLEHSFDDGDFNVHTLLEFASKKKLKSLAEDDVYAYGNFCWIDFEELDGLNELPGQAIAELLYLGHLMDHLKPPFYNYLNNQFVYLAHDDGWYNKTYYRSLNDFHKMLGDVIAYKKSHLKLEKSLLGIKKKKQYPSVPIEVIVPLIEMMKEGIVISLQKIWQNRNRMEIPIWVLGDFSDMDNMYDEYEKVSNQQSDAKLIFDKKTREWKVNIY
ncbi:hypothetical protein [Bacillus sp. 03113]|uniref:hypothetical protein n=1 Tax=Bacillus sp. 03113 TaxID=2578211 RepID=UPI001141E354|nr:hypothetical protein [Bacillus sp. 03113]